MTFSEKYTGTWRPGDKLEVARCIFVLTVDLILAIMVLLIMLG